MNWVLTAIAAAAGAGVVWGTAQGQIADKLDATRFVTDSTRRDERDNARDLRIESVLLEIRSEQRETNERLREITCPPTARGCR